MNYLLLNMVSKHTYPKSDHPFLRPNYAFSSLLMYLIVISFFLFLFYNYISKSLTWILKLDFFFNISRVKPCQSMTYFSMTLRPTPN